MLYGVLGAGQLAWMLGLAAKKQSLECRCIDPALVKVEEQQEALKGCDFVTFESEFLNYPLWKKALSECNLYPAQSVMEQLSDKWQQKRLFEKFYLPTAKAELIEKLPTQKGVAKWTRQGYDGYGNFVVTEDKLLSKNSAEFEAEWKVFAEKAKTQNSRIYFEELVAFDSECALLVARDCKGAFLKYPLIQTEQKNSVCEWAWGPLKSPDHEVQLQKIWPHIQTLLNSLNYVGVIAFEFFWAKGELLLNEVAPRVHNSGHITLDSFNYSQFDLHLMAAQGFGEITLESTAPNFIMKNLLGTQKFSTVQTPSVGVIDDSLKLYWYGKSESRPGRKLGHLNYTFKDENPLDVKKYLEEKEVLLWQKLKARN